MDLVTQDNGPDETENQFAVSFFNIGGTNTDELNTFALQKVQSVVQVFKLLHLHARTLVDRDGLRRDDFKKSVQVKTVVKVSDQVFNLLHALNQIGVYPSGEGLLLYSNPGWFVERHRSDSVGIPRTLR